jgi:hypothetical protein
MGRCVLGLLIAIWVITLSGWSLWAQSADPAQRGVSARDRFSGRIAFGLRDAQQEIHYQVLSLAPEVTAAPPPFTRPNVSMLPLKGTVEITVYELRVGKLATIIDGERQERREGEFWVVLPGQSIVLEGGDDSVVVQAIQFPDR